MLTSQKGICLFDTFFSLFASSVDKDTGQRRNACNNRTETVHVLPDHYQSKSTQKSNQAEYKCVTRASCLIRYIRGYYLSFERFAMRPLFFSHRHDSFGPIRDYLIVFFKKPWRR